MTAVSHFKITHGLAFEICKTHHEKCKLIFEHIDNLCAKYGARKGRYMSFGTKVEGLWFDKNPGKAWRASKQKGCHGYYVPKKTNKEGREIIAELEWVTLVSGEELAKDMGCQTFFTDFETGGQYMANMGITEVGGVFYAESAKYAPPALSKFGDGIVQIERGEYYTAIDAKKKTATGG